MEENKPWSHSASERSAETAEQLRALREQAEETLGAQRRCLSEIETEINHRVQQIAEELALEFAEDHSEERSPEFEDISSQLKKTAQDRDLLVEDLAQLNEQIDQQSEDLTAKAELLEETSSQLKASEDQLEEMNHQLADLNRQLAEKDDLITEKTDGLDLLQQEHQQTCDQLNQQLEESRGSLENLRDESCRDCDQLQQEIDDAEEKWGQLQEQIGSLENERDAAHQSLQERVATQEETVQTLRDAEAKIQELLDRPELDDELQQMRRKFELALADVQKHKRLNTDLQEELSHRPEASDEESPELVSLRAERDALAARVTELESAPPSVADADAHQEMADLQRRFELAVDDVRELKQENAELRKQSASSSSSAPAPDGPLDWQAQKARLLASLAEEDGETITDERHADRTTVEGTISITDRVVAEKDQEIEELRDQLQSQLKEQDTKVNQEQIEAAIREELFNNDELIQEEKAKLEQIQAQWQEKLREAELSISVERASLAREQAALEEKLAVLKNMPSADGNSADEKPRRRWLASSTGN